jgi:hypothetical protein
MHRYLKRFPPGKILSSIEEKIWDDKSPFTEQTTIFPRSINFQDIDEAVFDWFNGRDIVIDTSPVEAYFMSPEKWAEFKLQWKNMDGDRNIDFPYITIRRTGFAPAATPRKGRIPGKKFTIYRFPVSTANGPSVMHYRVPQPIKVDMEYEVRVLSHYISDINVINELLLRHFASLQAYLDIDKHYMPMLIESISDETETDNIEDERVLHTGYSIKVQAYIIDEDEFEEKLGVSEIIVNVDEEPN